MSSDMNTSESIQKLSLESAIPDGVEWDWRRVWVEGQHSNYGENCLNGSDNVAPGYGSAADFNFTSISGNGFNDWAGTVRNESGGHVGDYRLKSETHLYEGGFSMDDKVDVGETMNTNDDIRISYFATSVSNCSQIQLEVWFYETDGTMFHNSVDTWYSPSTGSSWVQHTLVRNIGFIYDVGYVRIWDLHGGFRVRRQSSGSNVRADFDDIRIYSEASNLPPAARIQFTCSELDEGTTYFIEADVLVNNVSGVGYLELYYEDPDDGLYYNAKDGGSKVADFDDETSGFELEVTLVEEAVGARLMFGTSDSGGAEIHINEIDDFEIIEEGK